MTGFYGKGSEVSGRGLTVSLLSVVFPTSVRLNGMQVFYPSRY